MVHSRSFDKKDVIMPDIVIPIVFPDYLISVSTPKKRIVIPVLIPGFDILPDKVVIPQTKNKVPQLGHAGVLFIRGATGTTKYYEYGRYVTDHGSVNKLTIRDVKMAKDHPTRASLAYTLSQISAKTGQNGLILGAYIEVDNKYNEMLNYADKRRSQNNNPKREEYKILSNSCLHFMKGVMEAGGVDTPFLIDPRPNSYIEEIRDDFPSLEYNKKTNTLKVEDGPDSLTASSLTKMQQQAASA